MMIEGQGILLLGDNDVDGGEGRELEGSRGGLPEEIMPSYTEQLLTSHNLPYHPSEDDEQCEITNVRSPKSHFRDDSDRMQEYVPS